MNTGEIWWEATPNNLSVRNAVSTALRDDISVCLIVGEKPVAWRDIFLDLLQKAARDISAEKQFEVLEPPYRSNPGEHLIKRFCTEADRVGYWPGQDSAEFLAGLSTTVLHNRFVYVSGLKKAECEKWELFVKKYTKKLEHGEHAVFILECCDNSVGRVSGMEYIDYRQNTSEQDCFMFCLATLSTMNCGHTDKGYIAQIAANLADGDIELAGGLASNGTALAEKTYHCAHQLIPDKDGTLSETVEKAVWDAQIKYLFPLLEQYRSSFIRKYDSILNGFLPIKNSYGEQVTDVKDLELSGLRFLSKKMNSKRITLDSQELLTLENSYQARNRLAHVHPVSYGELMALSQAICME